MSRIGKNPISIPENVNITIEGLTVKVKGPKGELSFTHQPAVKIEMKDNIITLSLNNETKEAKSFWGLTRTLINNMIIGVTNGFSKELEIIGVGYKAEVQGQKIILSLGYSHKIDFIIPKGISVEHKKEKNDILKITGINKEKVGAVAAKIRSYRKPEPYKGKGIRYIEEYVPRKEGKTAAAKA